MTRIWGALFGLLLLISPVLAQWQVPAGTVPVGRGPGVTGFNSSSGVPTNTRIAKSANYTVLNTNHGTFALGGNTYFTLTFTAASNYDATYCTVVINEDTARGKKIAPSGVTAFILWPLQQTTVCNQNNAWVYEDPGRWRIPSGVTFQVDQTNGVDTTDCLGITTTACKTISGADNVIKKNVDLNAFQPTIQLNTNYTLGTEPAETTGISLTYARVGSNEFTLDLGGHTITCSASITCFTVREPGSVVTFSNGTLVSGGSGSTGIAASQGAVVDFSVPSFNFGTFTAGTHLVCTTGAFCNFLTSYTISGSAVTHIQASYGAYVNYGSITVTLTGTPAFTVFATVTDNARINDGGVAPIFSGSATGQKYVLTTGGYIEQPSSGRAFPGNSNGSPLYPETYYVVAQEGQAADVNYQILTTDRILKPSAAFTTARTWTLPLANSVNPGHVVRINATSAVVNYPLNIAPHSPDLLNDSASPAVFFQQYTEGVFWSNGVNGWYSWQPRIRPGWGSTTTLYVNGSLGNNNNLCITSGAGACATIQHAVDLARGYDGYAAGSGGVYIAVADGTYTENINIYSSVIGNTTITLAGNDTTPGNVIIDGGGGTAVTVQDHSGLTISGFRLQGNIGLYSRQYAIIDFQHIEWNATGINFEAVDNSALSQVGPDAIIGNAIVHVFATNNSLINLNGTTTIGSARAFTVFAEATNSSTIAGVPVYSGAGVAGTTGSRFFQDYTSLLPPAITFPGNTAGTYTAAPVTVGGTGLSTFGGTNTILYTTTANNLSSFATCNNGVITTSAGGVPSCSVKSAFRADRNSVNQTGLADGVFVKFAANNAVFNQGSNYDAVTNFRWTPPASIITVGCTVVFTDGVTTDAIFAAIRKNGADLLIGYSHETVDTNNSISVTVVDSANGTDYYECFVNLFHGSGTHTINGLATASSFWGKQ